MFIKQVHVGRHTRLARLDIKLEQSAAAVGFRTTDRDVERRLVFVVDRVRIYAVGRTQELARA